MNDHSDRRGFSERKHDRGDWETTVFAPRCAILRFLPDFLSYKRRLVDQCARQCPEHALAIDIGCGNGAYSHWFVSRSACRVVAVDWSPTALSRIGKPKSGTIMPVCADVQYLPFKSEIFDGLFSIDTIGHLEEPSRLFDEILRVAKKDACIALHSECADYRERWPDKQLIGINGEDLPAREDGHYNLLFSRELRQAYIRRFELVSFFSPAGYLGWLTGYPGKYRPAFKAAGWRLLSLVTLVLAWCRRIPVVGGVLRIVNAVSNHCEVFLGLDGGGSCFAFLIKPGNSRSRQPVDG